MDAAGIRQAFRSPSMGTVAAVSYGLEQAPKFTLSVLNGALFAAATNLQARIENQRFAEQLIELMRDCGPWREGPRTAETSRLALDKLPPGREAATILDPYYFDFSMVYGDETAREGDVQLFSHAYRLRPCGVVALNFDPRRDDGSLLIDSVICVAYLRGSDLWGRPETFWAMWQEGLPLGDQCLFEIPRWGQLRRITTEAANNALRQLLERQCSLAVEKEAASVEQAAALMDGFDGKTILPTPVERGFPNLAETVWFGDEPFPALGDFEYQLIGADMRQRKHSVPLWFRPSRADFREVR